MKYLTRTLAALVLTASLTGTALASGQEAPLISPAPTADAPFTLLIDGTAADLSDTPCQPYYEGDSLMVPLYKVGLALGYEIHWDPETGLVTVEDSIQRAVLRFNTETVVFEGKLEIIDLSREVSNSAKTVSHGWRTYVPVQFFEEFFNDVAVDGTTISVSPSRMEIQAP